MINTISKIFKILDRKQKKKLIVAQLLLLFAALFEMLGVISIAPLIQLISDNQILENKNVLVTKIYEYLNFSTYTEFLRFISISVLIIFLINFFVALYTIFFISKFAQDSGNYIKIRLFKNHSLEPWIYHSQRDTSSIVNKIHHEANRVSQSAILPLLNTNAKLLIGLAIIIFIFLYNPKVSTICFSVFLISYFLIFKLIKKKIDFDGFQLSNTSSDMYKKIIETFGGIKETILHKKQKKFHDEFYSKAKEYSNAAISVQFFQQSPKFFLELIAFSIIILSILFISLTSLETNLKNSLPIMAVYTFAGYKLLPIFQAIYQGLLTIRSSGAAIENIYAEVSNEKDYSFPIEKKDEKEQFNLQKNIKLDNVSFSYLNSNKPAVNNVSLNISKNSLTSIVGPSGAGKSTILDIILGLIEPQSGNILIDDIPLVEKKDLYQNNISYVGQSVFLQNDTIKSNICFGVDDSEIDQKKLFNAIEASYLSELIKELPNGIDTVVGERGVKISGGQRQRVAIARALYLDRSIIILDEATSSLDGITQGGILEKLKLFAKDFNKTIIMVTHNINLTRDSNIIYLVNRGEIHKNGTFDQLLDDEIFVKLLNQN